MTPLLRRALWCLLHLPLGLGLYMQDAAKAQESPAIYTLPAGAEIVHGAARSQSVGRREGRHPRSPRHILLEWGDLGPAAEQTGILFE